ncbi:TadE/TadG family type IV pilus assembly protein [Actibacterium pelagium]|nr:hypothetical protein [Actibacterium pelagium]
MSFWKDESGAVTVESVMWLGFMFFFVLSILDICVYFLNHGWAVRAMHQENREFIVGAYSDCNALETALNQRIQAISPSGASACDTYPERGSTFSTVTVTLASSEMGLGIVTYFLKDINISSTGFQTIEVPTAATTVKPPVVETDETTTTETVTDDSATTTSDGSTTIVSDVTEEA